MPRETSTTPGSTTAETATMLLGRQQFDAMWSTHRRLFDHVARMNRMWVENVREATQASSQLTRRLAECEDPARVRTICGDWLRGRGEHFLAESRRATQLWAEFCQGVHAEDQAEAPTAVTPRQAAARAARSKHAEANAGAAAT